MSATDILDIILLAGTLMGVLLYVVYQVKSRSSAKAGQCGGCSSAGNCPSSAMKESTPKAPEK
ncbi:MAG: hypothetical protein HON94_00360 [Methylococcales bacterium]|jgi:hypothetical protein|nr:hypothetical protein [Methylococcales bacterium]MBT7408107.1 hypothetical protein [Methylococcales bacterium]